MFNPEILTPELETSIVDASAWAQVIPTDRVKPNSHIGALVTESFSQLKEDVSKLEQRLQAETREEFNIILAQI